MQNLIPFKLGKIQIAIMLFSGFSIVGCDQSGLRPEKEREELSKENVVEKDPFVSSIEEAARMGEFAKHANVSFDIDLSFGGKASMNAHVEMATNSTRIKIEKSNGTTLIYDGSKGYLIPDTSSLKGARFDLFTWTYFFALPYKLSDPGTIWNDFDGTDILNGIKYNTKKLTFNSTTGDSPDDWYVLYSDLKTDLPAFAGYIVTASKSVEEAEKQPHAIGYSDYEPVNGIPISRTWTFYKWDGKTGLGDEIGKATISNVQFSNGNPETYSVPQNAKVIPE